MNKLPPPAWQYPSAFTLEYGGSPILALVLGFIVYPGTLAPTGDTTNGGAFGLVVIILASIISWSGYFLSLRFQRSKYVRMLIHLPCAGVITYFAILEISVQIMQIRMEAGGS